MGKRLQLFFLCMLLALLCAVVWGLLAEGNPTHCFFASVLAGLSVPFLLVAAVAFFIWLCWNSLRAGLIALILVCAGSACLIQLISLPVGKHVSVSKAKSFCESLVPKLDGYKQEAGKYPQGIEEVMEPASRLPYLLRDQGFYHCESGGKSFSFEFEGPHEANLFHSYCSDDREWRTYRGS